MKELFLINDTPANRISYYHILLFLLLLPYDLFFTGLILISFAVHTLLHSKANAWKAVFGGKVLALQAVFLVLLAGTAYAPSIRTAIDDCSRQVSIFVFPLLLGITTLDLRRYRQRLLSVFAAGVTFTILWLFYNAVVLARAEGLPVSGLFSAAFTNQNFSRPIDIHATYLSIYVSVAFIHFLFLLFTQKEKWRRVLCAVCCLVLLGGLLQLASRSVCIATGILVNLAFPWLALKGKMRLYFISASLLVSATLFIIINRTEAFHERYVRDFAEEMGTGRSTSVDEEPRVARWEVAMELVKKRPVLGYGTGSEIPLLRDAYYRNKLFTSYLNSLNAHNEYLSLLIQTGLAGLLVYIAALFYLFRQSLARRDIVFFTCVFLVAIVSVSENILDVNKGIFFYAFFPSFLLFADAKNRKK